MLDVTPAARAQVFLDRFGEALAKPDIEAAVAMFAEDSYWRDLVSFTWNIKTVEGRDEIRDMLTHCLATVKPRDWRVAEREPASEAGDVLEAWFAFETEVGAGLRAGAHPRRADLDAADDLGRAQGLRGEGRLHTARSGPSMA